MGFCFEGALLWKPPPVFGGIHRGCCGWMSADVLTAGSLLRALFWGLLLTHHPHSLPFSVWLLWSVGLWMLLILGHSAHGYDSCCFPSVSLVAFECTRRGKVAFPSIRTLSCPYRCVCRIVLRNWHSLALEQQTLGVVLGGPRHANPASSRLWVPASLPGEVLSP